MKYRDCGRSFHRLALRWHSIDIPLLRKIKRDKRDWCKIDDYLLFCISLFYFPDGVEYRLSLVRRRIFPKMSRRSSSSNFFSSVIVVSSKAEFGCIFRKNCASVPEERSAIPLQPDLRCSCLQDCRLATVRVQYGVVVAVILDVKWKVRQNVK